MTSNSWKLNQVLLLSRIVEHINKVWSLFLFICSEMCGFFLTDAIKLHHLILLKKRIGKKSDEH